MSHEPIRHDVKRSDTMAKKNSKTITKKLRQLGDIQVNSWEFPEFLNKDIKELEIGESLKRLGRVQVTDWDFSDVLPAINKVAQTEIDIDGFVRRTANYKVIDWDFRDALKGVRKTKVSKIVESLSSYLHFTISQLIQEPKYLSIHAKEIAPRVIEFQAVMTRKDTARLIGMDGKTAGPVRRLLKASANYHGATALLRILSHEEASNVGR